MRSELSVRASSGGEPRLKSVCRSIRIFHGRCSESDSREQGVWGNGARGRDEDSGLDYTCNRCAQCYMECKRNIVGCDTGALAGPASFPATFWSWGKPASVRSFRSAGREYSGVICRERSGLCWFFWPWSLSQRGSRRQLDEVWPGCE